MVQQILISHYYLNQRKTLQQKSLSSRYLYCLMSDQIYSSFKDRFGFSRQQLRYIYIAEQ